MIKKKTAKRIPYVPRWAGPIEGHAVNVIKSFFPRLCAEHEFCDLLQEAYIIFMKCKNAYGGKVDNRAWFMALFSRSLTNRMIGLLDRSGRYIFIEDEPEIDEPVKEDLTFLGLDLKERLKYLMQSQLVRRSEHKARAAARELCKMFPEVAAAL